MNNRHHSISGHILRPQDNSPMTTKQMNLQVRAAITAVRVYSLHKQIQQGDKRDDTQRHRRQMKPPVPHGL